MTALGFSEHGSVFEWYHKKTAIEAEKMKYIHAAEFYLTETLQEKARDNYHCVVIARNYEGFLELNRLASAAFNRKDNHFYYTPRISFVKQFLLRDNMGISSIKSAEIISFNTIAPKGAIRDVCRALYKDDSKVNYIQLANQISKKFVVVCKQYNTKSLL